ncbi:MAG TPA: hypothetical protein VNZ55_14020 [Thermomicrobiales bacterium]|nr:hypothetical protein [Thermomicrobiales bacterium]
MTGPVAPPRVVVPGDTGHILLRRVMKVRSDLHEIARITLVDQPDLRIILRDTGPEGTSSAAIARDTAIHLLWARDDASAHLTIDHRRTPIAPGDMIVLPAGTGWRASPGLILCEISTGAPASPGQRAADLLPSPTHGNETFHGYNRQTTYPAPSGIAISRWKITEPLELSPSSRDRYIVDLAAPVAMFWPTGTDLIGRGECRHIPPTTNPVTLLPDGLGYVLVVDAPQ